MHPFILLLFSAPALATSVDLPPELKDFLGKPPAFYEKRFLTPARALRSAMEKVHAGKPAAKELTNLAAKGEMMEHAAFELAELQRQHKEYAASTRLALRVLYEFPGTVYRELLEDTIEQNDCDQGLVEAKRKSATAVATLQRCLGRLTWKEWLERGAELEALYGLLKSGKDPLFGPFVAELIQALPASAKIRVKIQREIPSKDLTKYASLARYRVRNPPPAGVRPVNPDADLFDAGMQAVLGEKWSAAEDSFKKIVADYPQSEHLDRAQYWIARCEDARGYKDEARRRFEEIAQNPLTYYGMQSALRLGRDLSQFVVPADVKTEPLTGTLLPKQALSLWRLRALLEVGLIDSARMEAKTLFQYRPGGATFGQDDPAGAILTALLFHSAGYSQGAFAHAYAAISLDPTQLNAYTLDLIFPNSYRTEFEAASELTGVHPLLLLSLSKQESAFQPNAVSRVNAAGLMQLMFATAREMHAEVAPRALFTPSTNTQIGSRYLKKLLDRYQGNIALALAAYNAGPTRASQWQKRFLETERMKTTFDVDTFIDTIPFTETRKYVGSILRNYAWYKLLHKDGKLGTVEELAFQWQRVKKEEVVPPPPATPEANPEAAPLSPEEPHGPPAPPSVEPAPTPPPTDPATP